MYDDFLIYSSIFEEVAEAMNKLAYIKKLPSGDYAIFSEKGKRLGKYKSKSAAEKRLQQIEYFKHKKAARNIDLTYSSAIRTLRGEDELITTFRQAYKDKFDECLLHGELEPEETALDFAIEAVNAIDDQILKQADALPLGDPAAAGERISALIKFLMQRISQGNRPGSMRKLRQKILQLNEQELSQKKLPASSAMGQSIVLVKNLLFTHSASYIREVLDQIGKHLESGNFAEDSNLIYDSDYERSYFNSINPYEEEYDQGIYPALYDISENDEIPQVGVLDQNTPITNQMGPSVISGRFY